MTKSSPLQFHFLMETPLNGPTLTSYLILDPQQLSRVKGLRHESFYYNFSDFGVLFTPLKRMTRTKETRQNENIRIRTVNPDFGLFCRRFIPRFSLL